MFRIGIIGAGWIAEKMAHRKRADRISDDAS
jgi:predicted dehydrogenase